MKRLLKTINRYNGNLCFVGGTENYDIVFECDRFGKTVQYQQVSKRVSSLCGTGPNGYMMVFSDNYLGLYRNDILTENYIDTGISRIDRVASRKDEVYYGLDRVNGIIYRFSIDPFTVDWTLTLEWTNGGGEILVRESDETLIYYDDEVLCLIGDTGTSGVPMGRLPIGNGSGIFLEGSGELNPSYAFLRWRIVSGEEMNQSSSSSSSSSVSSSSSSSLSSSSSSSSSSSIDSSSSSS